MTTSDLKSLIQEIVEKGRELKDRHTSEKNAHVNYACIFAQNQDEYDTLLATTQKMGRIIQETPTGPLFHINPLDTAGGKLRLLKIRVPAKTHPDRGDADFTVEDYATFKKTSLAKSGFKLIERSDIEMIELMDPLFKVRAYFSHPPLDEQLGLI